MASDGLILPTLALLAFFEARLHTTQDPEAQRPSVWPLRQDMEPAPSFPDTLMVGACPRRSFSFDTATHLRQVVLDVYLRLPCPAFLQGFPR
jgi:hypothetical protein